MVAISGNFGSSNDKNLRDTAASLDERIDGLSLALDHIL